MLGIGGGGDVVGALATGRLCEQLGAEVTMGGVAWERLPIDPHPGPRGADEIIEASPLAPAILSIGPETRTTAGALFAEAHMARYLDRRTILVDILGGPKSVAAGLEQAAKQLGADLVAFVDVGGDVLGNGSEPGLASPLCDAVMLAAATHLARSGTATLGAVFGPCCDGELTMEEILDRLAQVASGGGLLGVHGMSEDIARELEEVSRLVPTEASAQAIRCARGELGITTIRRGRRTVMLSPVGALTFYFDVPAAFETTASLARAVMDTESLDEANDALHELDVTTELDFERSFMEA